MSMTGYDWTVSAEGRSNSSKLFRECEAFVADLIGNSAWALVNNGPRAIAELVVAQLAHVFGMVPTRLAERAGPGDGHGMTGGEIGRQKAAPEADVGEGSEEDAASWPAMDNAKLAESFSDLEPRRRAWLKDVLDGVERKSRREATVARDAEWMATWSRAGKVASTPGDAGRWIDEPIAQHLREIEEAVRTRQEGLEDYARMCDESAEILSRVLGLEVLRHGLREAAVMVEAKLGSAEAAAVNATLAAIDIDGKVMAAAERATEAERRCWNDAVHDFKEAAEGQRPDEEREDEDDDEHAFIDHAVHSANSIAARAAEHRQARMASRPPLSTVQAQVLEFHRAMGQPILATPQVPGPDRLKLRALLVAEEFFEFLEAMGFRGNHEVSFDIPHGGFVDISKGRFLGALRGESIDPGRVDLPKAADALADIDYVVEGTRLEFGIQGAPIAALVHAANMAKAKGPVSPEGKRLKPAGWSPPDIVGELRRQGWRPDP